MVEIVPTGFGGAAADYARHRAGVPAALFERLERFGVGSPGQVVIDRWEGEWARSVDRLIEYARY